MASNDLNSDSPNCAPSSNEKLLHDALSKFESYLRLLAEVQIGQILQSRVGASDVLQETFLDAALGWGKFRGQTEAELLAWIKKILLNNVNQAFRFHTAGKRSIKREVSLDRLNTMHQSSVALEEVLCAQISSPSEPAKRHETVLIVADCLAELSEKHHEIVLQRTLLGKPYSVIAQDTGKTESGCRMLWLRAIKELRNQFKKRNLV